LNRVFVSVGSIRAVSAVTALGASAESARPDHDSVGGSSARSAAVEAKAVPTNGSGPRGVPVPDLPRPGSLKSSVPVGCAMSVKSSVYPGGGGGTPALSTCWMSASVICRVRGSLSSEDALSVSPGDGGHLLGPPPGTRQPIFDFGSLKVSVHAATSILPAHPQRKVSGPARWRASAE
jgi:hypothetical protein